jgi:aryl-alcohol dehydrogenase-like predicted oxidoreductase
VRISALNFGGHHSGDTQDEKSAHSLIHEATGHGVTFFDNCWETGV